MNMDVCQNVSVSVSVSGDCQKEQVQVLAPSCSKLSTSSTCLDDLFSAQNTEVDVGLEWLSVFVEDCFSSPPSCVLGSTSVHATTTKNPSTTLLKKRPQESNESSLTKFSVPGKARSKRKRLSAPRSANYRDPLSIWSHNLNLNPSNDSLMISDPPLLKQEYWLADSELFVPKQKQNKKDNDDDDNEQQQGVAAITKDCKEEEQQQQQEQVLLQKGLVMRKESFGFDFGFGFVECENEGSSNNNNENGQNSNQLVPRRCTHCLAQRTPQWRAGPLGPKTLCNACGVRYKSGRLLPEYRPAKSPTFVSYLHSNSHKKVMEMRMHGHGHAGSSSILHS